MFNATLYSNIRILQYRYNELFSIIKLHKNWINILRCNNMQMSIYFVIFGYVVIYTSAGIVACCLSLFKINISFKTFLYL